MIDGTPPKGTKVRTGISELIDARDNDCHDSGNFTEMYLEASARNELELVRHWVVKPEGFSERHFKG